MLVIDWIAAGVITVLMLLGSKAEYEVIAYRINGGGGLVYFVCRIVSVIVLLVCTVLSAIFSGLINAAVLLAVGWFGLKFWDHAFYAYLRWYDARRNP